MRRRAALAAAAVGFALLAVELGLRMTIGLGDPPLFQADEEIGYLMAPGQEVYRLGNRIAINRFHQRSDEITLEPESGVLRIFFLGDSITFGISAVDQSETYPEIVAETLRRKGRQAEALNASAVSWGIGNERAYVDRFGAFASRIAILQIGSSDLLQPTSTAEVVGVSPAYPDKKPLSAIGELLNRYLLPRLADVLGYSAPAREEPVTPEARNARFEANMEEFQRLVDALHRESVQPVVLLMPGLPELLDTPERLDRYVPYRRRFIALARQLSLPVIDIAALWKGDPAVASYYSDGTHLTAEGNHALAQILASFLIEHGFDEAPSYEGASPLAAGGRAPASSRPGHD